MALREDQVEMLEQLLDHQQTINQSLLEQVRWNAMLAGEDLGWSAVSGGGVTREGPDLVQAKEWAEKLREALGNVHMMQGLRLRTNNIWSGGIHYNKEALPEGSGRGQQTAKRVRDPLNQRNFFGKQAHDERESALYTDGIYLVLGDPSDWSLEPISIMDIGAIAYNPKRADEIIAYRHDYQDFSGPEPVSRKEWHYTDLAIGRRGRAGFGVKVQQGETAPDERVIFDQMVNTQVGWTLGVPDSLLAYAWAKVYRDFVMNGKVTTDAMAQFAFQVATGTKKETDTAAARLAEPSDAGATLVGANTLVPLATTGKAYDFSAGRPLLAIVASALEVSLVSLASDSEGQTAAATTLDLPTRLAMESRRQLHVDFDYRVLTWMGAGQGQNTPELEVTFSSLDDKADVYRELQALILALNSGLYEPEPIERRISQLLEVTGNTVPTDWIHPNTLKALKAQAKIKADAAPAPATDPAAGDTTQTPGVNAAGSQGKGATSSTASPEQGRSKASGKGGDKGNDIRTDTKK